MRSSLLAGIALAACAPLPQALPDDPPAEERPVITGNPGSAPLKGAAAGGWVCLISGLWLFPPACGAVVVAGALIGAAKASGPSVPGSP
ncbi:MAG: hypothetical protein ACRDT1_12770 [Micromonosporaceae bacterium]